MIRPDFPLVLGSASPRRSEILTTLGIAHRVVRAEIDERALPGETPDDYVTRIVEEKASAVREALRGDSFPAFLVADTLVTESGRILTKPNGDDEAVHMIERLQGRTHVVLTRYRIETPTAEARSLSVATEVTFRRLDRARIESYVATGEGRDKAGAYAVQGRGAFLVERIAGSYSGVVGLPACETMLSLEELGLVALGRDP